MRRNIPFMISILLISGCSLLNRNTTIDRLRADGASMVDVPLPRVSHQDVRNEYRALLEIVDEAGLRKQIERRIAGVYMLEGDHNQFVGTTPPKDGYFANAIESYKEVIDKYPNDPDNAESYYQLAKAYDLDGKDREALATLDTFINKFPTSQRLPEAYFRKADIHFRHAEYEDAERAYQAVISNGEGTPFVNNSYYLLGWSRYKQSDYEGGMRSFAKVLDRLVPDDGKVEKLDKVERSLVDDTLHIMSLSLAYDGGADKIGDIFAKQPQSKKYQWLLYSGLGRHFLEKERYEDSASSYRAFVMTNPTSDRAPEMHAEMIRTYVDGKFNSLVMPEKEHYVQNYGVRSAFWKTKDDQVKAKVIPNLKTYLDELARHYHGTGQKLKKELAESDLTHGKRTEMAKTEKDDFLKAARYYQEFMDTFPKAPERPRMVYMRAEALFDGEDYVNAIDGYEATAYGPDKGEFSADAGYAAIVAYQKQADILKSNSGGDSPQLADWLSKSVESQLRFVKAYPNDKRSGSVLAKTSEELLDLKQYERALEVATSIVAITGKKDEKLSKTAYGVIAHCQYELGNYAEAEAGYRSQLKYIHHDDKDQGIVTERLATTIYQQGDAALKANDTEAAIQNFLRIKKDAPASSVRVAAQYDAATQMLSLGRWKPALKELMELRARVSIYEITKDVSQKIAYAYEQDGQIRNAAEEYMAIYNGNADEAAKRDALFIAAELYEKAGDDPTAIEYFKRWAHAYEEPFDNRMEARYHLACLYRKTDDMTRHLYWLRRVIDGDRNAGDKRTERSQWLAAWANAEYGDYWAVEFDHVKLLAPFRSPCRERTKS